VKTDQFHLLNELTIGIFIYNHPFELELAFDYWRDTPVTVQIKDWFEKPFRCRV
jgi:hypothetical protein